MRPDPRLQIMGLSLAGATLLFAFGTVGAATGLFDSIDLKVLRSERVALIRIESSTDSAFAPPAMVSVLKIRYRVLRNLRGTGDASGDMRIDVSKETPRMQAGDTVLWLREVRRDLDDQEDPPRREDALFDLSSLDRTPYEFARTGDFKVLHRPDAILAAITRRMRMIRGDRPLGDARRYSLDEFAGGLGATTTWMDPQSEAQEATYGGSVNVLSYPADADLLPELIEQTRSPAPEVRAFAAEALASYPTARGRLRELLTDKGTSLSLQGSGARVDSVWVPVVRNAARRALRAIDQRRPLRLGMSDE